MLDMVEINEGLIKQVARNANLELTQDEIQQFKKDFKEVLSYFEKLSEADVPKKPSFHPIELKKKTRKDDPTNYYDHKEGMRNVKLQTDGYIRGPKVI